MKYLILAAALCAGTFSAQAQSTPTDNKGTNPGTSTATTPQQPTAQDRKDCLKTSDADWKALGLSADQMTQVKAVQGGGGVKSSVG